MTLINSRNRSSIKDQPQKAMGREITKLQCRLRELEKEAQRIKNNGQDPRKFMSGRNMVRMDTSLEKIEAQRASIANEIKKRQSCSSLL